MDADFTLLVKFGERGCAKKVSDGFSRDDLVSFVVGKWNGLKKEEIYLSYDFIGAGELELGDEDDMVTMFRLLGESECRRVKVFVRRIGDSSVIDDNRGGRVTVTEVGESSQVVNVDVQPIDANAMLVDSRLLSEDWRMLITGPGQRFPGGVVQFRKALIKYSVQVGFEFDFLRNGPKRVSAACKFRVEKSCLWRITAIEDASDGAFYITFYERNHVCGTSFGNVSRRRINHHVVADLVVEDIRSMSALNPGQVQALVKKNYGFDISYSVAWKALDKGRSLVYGDHTSSFAVLPGYFRELIRANPDSFVHVDIDEEQRFRRCFVAYGACVLGFSHCRPMLIVDGTFLKGRHKGCLLSAVAKDGDDGIYPVAFAVVNEETDDNWAYFFHHLKLAVGVTKRIVFVSDRNHGILKAVEAFFPECPHAYCYNHLKSNLEYRCRALGKRVRAVVLRYFQKCAYATSVQQFEENCEKLLKVGGGRAEAFLRDTPKQMWACAFFEGCRYGQMTSNAAESWNAQIRDERLLPIVSMLDGIRIKLMQQITNRRQQGAGWTTVLCRSIDAEMCLRVEQARGWDIRKASESIYEVFSMPSAVVDIENRKCTCMMWQINGLPCVHAAGVIFLKLNGKYDLVDPVFHVAAYRATYEHAIMPFTMPAADGDGIMVRAPEYHQTRGRPKRRRVPSQGENIRRRIRCGLCGQLANHNRKTCRMGRDRG